MANDKFILDIAKLKSGLMYAALKYRDNTKQYIKANDIWETGDLWNSIQADSEVKQKGSVFSVIIGVNNSMLGKHHKVKKDKYGRYYPYYVHNGANYEKRSLIPRPFFDKTYEKNKDVYDKIIRDAIDVNII